jgi:hypothetical protein
MTDKRAISKGLWAPIATPERGRPWVLWIYVRSTRHEAKSAYLSGYDKDTATSALKRVRFARVTITEDSND